MPGANRSAATLLLAVLGLPVCLAAVTQADPYSQTLNTLDSSQPESVCQAREALQQILSPNPAENAEPFRSFRAFFLHATATTGPAFAAAMSRYTSVYEEWATGPGKDLSIRDFLLAKPEVAQAGARWFRCGFSVYDSEGELYPNQDPSTLLQFADNLPPDLAAYIRFRAQEDSQTVIEDAALQVSWEDLRLRLERWEAFGAQHPTLPETHLEVEPTTRALLVLYIFGSDNTPAFDLRKNGRLDHKLLASWHTFKRDDKSSRYQPLISELADKIPSHDHTLTPRDRPLFARFGLEQEFDQTLAYLRKPTLQ